MWTLNAEGSGGCSIRGLLVVVMTMDRAQSLQRLLASLETAEYAIDVPTDLRVNVDLLNTGLPDAEVSRLW